MPFHSSEFFSSLSLYSWSVESFFTPMQQQGDQDVLHSTDRAGSSIIDD